MKRLLNRTSPRKKGYDYSSPGRYFITICTKYGIHYFGKIRDGKMILNNLGKIVFHYWETTPSHFPNVIIDEFVVMQNHIHALIIITKRQKNQKSKKSGSISTIVGSYKSICTKTIREKFTKNFQRQGRFHDSIIYDQEGFNRVKCYIRNNPKNWNRKKWGKGRTKKK